MSYTVKATFTVEISNPAAVASLANMAGVQAGDERAQLQAAANVGLSELGKVAGGYGVSISDANATVLSRPNSEV